ncbi:MAG: hypothetical protein ABUS57_15670, partial [Pseudomonadota bacterium]
IAALAFALALLLHCLVFGAEAARSALPQGVARAMLALGAGLGLLSAGAPVAPFAPQAGEAGLFLASVAAFGLFTAALAGRASSLRDEPW